MPSSQLPTYPTVNNGTLTIQKNGIPVATFTANQSGNSNANISVPTTPSDIDAASESDVASTQTATGNPLTLSGVAPINAEKLEVVMEPKQDLHGQNYPYVGGAGKNIIPMTVEGIKAANSGATWSGNSATISNVVFTIQTDSDGNVTGIKVSGTSNGAINFILATNQTLKSGTYTLSHGGVANSSGSGNSFLYVRDVGGNITLIDDSLKGTTSKTATLSNDIENVMYYFNIASGITMSGTILPQLELGSTATTFAPYTNICPISGYDSVSVDDVGKNLWDEIMELGMINDTTGEDVENNTRLRTKNCIRIVGGVPFYGVVPFSGDDIKYYYYDKNKSFISHSGWQYKGECTPPNNAVYMRFWVAASYGTTYKHDISMNYPSTDHDYHPYDGANATIQFGQTVYGGKSDFVMGGTKSKYGIIDLGSINYSYVSAQGYIQSSSTISDAKAPANNSEVADLICEGFAKNSAFNVYSGQSGIALTDNKLLRIRYDGMSTDPSEFKTAVSGIHLCYELAEYDSITTPIAPLKLLKGTNNLSTDGTSMTVGYQPDNVIGELKEDLQQHTEMEWLQVLLNGVQSDYKDIQLRDSSSIASRFILADLEVFKHRFMLFEIYRKQG